MLIRIVACVSLVAATVARSVSAAEAPKLGGTAAPFAGIPWDSTARTIETKLAQRGYRFIKTDEDGDLVFSGTTAAATTVFEVLGGTHRLVKTLIVRRPSADEDMTGLFHDLSASLRQTHGRPSEGDEGAMFWLYADGSSVYVHVTDDRTVETAYESTRWKAEAARRDVLLAGATQAAAEPVFAGPPGWQHAQGTSDGLGSWLHPSDTGFAQSVVVETKAGYTSLDALLRAEAAYIGTLPDQFGYAPTDATVCGNHPAKYLSYTYTSPSGLPVTVEVVIAVFGTTAYSAKYSKSISQNADAAAERSLTTLCGRK